MNRIFIRDIEEIREFIELQKKDEDYIDRVMRKFMRN